MSNLIKGLCLGLVWPILDVSGAQTAFEQACAQLAARQGSDAERLRELFRLDWENSMRENPEFATRVGYPGQNDRWTDESLEAIAQRERELRAPLEVLHSIDSSRLNSADRLNYDLFKKDKRPTRSELRYSSVPRPGPG